MTALHDGRRRVIAAVDPAAKALGLRPGMAVAQALTIVPGLDVAEADAAADRAALERLAHWCHRITPLPATDGDDGLWLDVAGCAHLAGGEPALLEAVLARFARDGLQAHAAAADTPGAAHALARYGAARSQTVPPGEQCAAIAHLPVAALRLPPDMAATLRRLGFEQVRHLSRIPRAVLARRFGPLPGLRLDQVSGRVHEPLCPLMPAHLLQGRTGFLEPLLTAEALAIAVEHLMAPICEQMERDGLGARQIDLLFERVDSHVAAIRVGTARPSRDAAHLVRMLVERLDTVDPGLGVEAMRLVVPLAEPLRWEQQESGTAAQDVSRLVDRLANRFGAGRLFQARPLESERPERSVVSVAPGQGRMSDFSEPLDPSAPATPPLAETIAEGQRASTMPMLALVVSMPSLSPRRSGPVPSHLHIVRTKKQKSETQAPEEQDILAWKRPWALRRITARPSRMPWPGKLQPPARLLDPPRHITALAALPDQPPVAFTWRNRQHKVRRADGPDRVHGEWWRGSAEVLTVRDYFQVEDERGQRFLLFREGNGIDPRSGDLSWYLHGFF